MRLLIATVVMLLAVAAGAVMALSARAPFSGTPALPVIADVGGDFELAGADGARVRSQDYRGRIMLLFFGYTYCPDVCPTSLYTLRLALERLGATADRVQVVMVTVDPERDSPRHMQEYVRYFDPRFLGLSGTADEIDRVARQYRVYHQKGQTRADGYLVTHSAYVYLLDQRGRVRALFGTGARDSDIVDDVRHLLREGR